MKCTNSLKDTGTKKLLRNYLGRNVLYSPMSIEAIKFVVKNCPTKKMEDCSCFKKEVMPILSKLFQLIEEEASIVLIPQSVTKRNRTEQNKKRQTSLMKYR